MIWKDKRVLITGGFGMIGRELIELLLERKAKVIVSDIKPMPRDYFGKVISRSADLRHFADALEVTEDVDYVFHLVGIKGNPRMTNEEPASFMAPMLQCDTNVIEAASLNGVKKFLYTSSIAVEYPDFDKYPSWAKKTAETLIEAYRIQYPNRTQFCIVRPANVYGRFDNFENPERRGMVITSLISKAIKHHSSFEVWGDGSTIRDFINARDVARGMIQAMEQMPEKPVNLCSGEPVTIKHLAEIIAKELRN